MSGYYISSDWHLDHQKAIEYNKRPFADLVEQINYFVKSLEALPPGSTMFLLGDLFVYDKKERVRNVLNLFPKHIDYVFILGNHDRGLAPVYKQYGRCAEFLEVKYKTHKLVLSHYPMYEWNRGQYGSLHCFGHCHGHFIHPGRAMDVGWDAHTQILLMDDVVRILLKKPIHQPCHSKNNGLLIAPDAYPKDKIEKT